MLFSIVIPTYRRPLEYLQASIDSALTQEGYTLGKDFEVIVVADGDPSAAQVIKGFEMREGLRYLEREENGGQSAALNTALPEVLGRYLMVHHDDDLLLPGKAKALVPVLEHNPEAGICSALSETIDAAGELLPEWNQKRKTRYADAAIKGPRLAPDGKYVGYIAGETALYRTAAIRAVGGWDEALPHAEEVDLQKRLWEAGWGVLHVNEVVARYRLHDANKSLKPDGKLRPSAWEVGQQVRYGRTAKIWASVTSTGNREEGLRATVAAILPQVHRLNVTLGRGYETTPGWLMEQAEEAQPRLHLAIVGDDDRGTAEKYRFLGEANEERVFFLTVDDDILYPPNYTRRLTAGLERYALQPIASFHGSRIKKWPVSNYYRERHCYHFKEGLEADTPVHVAAAVCAGWHTAIIRIEEKEFVGPHTQDDIWLAVAAHKRRIPRVVLKHPEGWIRPNPEIDQSDSVFERYRRASAEIARSLNELGGLELPLMRGAA